MRAIYLVIGVPFSCAARLFVEWMLRPSRMARKG